jgi:hypothetical protein
MRTFVQEPKPKLTQQPRFAKSAIPGRAHFGPSGEVGASLQLQRMIGNRGMQRLSKGNTRDVRGDSTTLDIGRFGHDFSRIPIHSSESAGRQSTLMVTTPGYMHAQETDRMAQQVMRVPEPPLKRACACGGDCPRCKSQQQGSRERPRTRNVSADRDGYRISSSEPVLHGASGIRESAEGGQSRLGPARSYFVPRFSHDVSQNRAHKDNRAVGLRANEQAAAFGPRSDGLDDAPYFGPGDPASDVQLGPGTETAMGCVIGPLRVVTSGALVGGYSVSDYLVGGLSWGTVGSPSTAGADGRGFKVQLCATYSNATSLGVSQSFTFTGANQAFLDTAAQYLGQPAGSVANGTTINEPVLNAGDPYAHTGWELQYGAKTGSGSASLVSFADVPRNQPGSKGSVDFRTCFYSRGGPCQEDKTCRTWRWTIDFTGTNNTNTVT